MELFCETQQLPQLEVVQIDHQSQHNNFGTHFLTYYVDFTGADSLAVVAF